MRSSEIFSSNSKLSVRFLWGLILSVFFAVLVFWWSPLSFFPVPWPDDSAFYLPGLEWIRWPSQYRMHAQAPFVPSYDQANFNTMPLMPGFLGWAYQLGFRSTHAIRIFGMLGLGLWISLLIVWLRRHSVSKTLVVAIAMAALFNPVIRWGAMIVRPEVWQVLLWTAILMEFDRSPNAAREWKAPLYLAIAAGLHFEAAFWIIPTTILILGRRVDWRSRFADLFLFGGRVALLLSPWLIYLLLHWDLFWLQMNVQFNRLADHHPYIPDLYGLFQSIFLSNGSPITFPKLLNPVKVSTWLLMVGLPFVALALWRRPRGPIMLAGAAGLVSTLYLWVTKPETWFTMMVHMALMVGWVAVLPEIGSAWVKRTLVCVFGLTAALGLGVAAIQWRTVHSVYTWDNYYAWVDCIESYLVDRKRVWQPGVPDVLVTLAGRNRDRDYTRAVDFKGIDHLIDAHAKSRDAIIHSTYLKPGEDWTRNYRGPAEEKDIYYVKTYRWTAWQEYSAPVLGNGWTAVACQNGPFWAMISMPPSGAAQ